MKPRAGLCEKDLPGVGAPTTGSELCQSHPVSRRMFLKPYRVPTCFSGTDQLAAWRRATFNEWAPLETSCGAGGVEKGARASSGGTHGPGEGGEDR